MGAGPDSLEPELTVEVDIIPDDGPSPVPVSVPPPPGVTEGPQPSGMRNSSAEQILRSPTTRILPVGTCGRRAAVTDSRSSPAGVRFRGAAWDTPPVSSRDRTVLIAAVALLVLPVLIDLAISGRERVFGYLAIDFFYYETIARNYLEVGFTSFDREYATNGYHPLWQYSLIAMAKVSTWLELSKLSFFLLALLASLCLCAGALVLLGRALVASEGRISAFFPLAVPGAFAIVTSPIYQPSHDFSRLQVDGGERAVVGTLWRYVNGMETGLVLLTFFAATVLLIKLLDGEASRETRRRCFWGCGIALGFLALSRLDHAIFSVTLPLAVLLDRPREKQARKVLMGLWAIVGAFLIAYVTFNTVNFGAAVPVSGSVKSTFPRFNPDNWRDLVSLLSMKRTVWVYDAWRLAQELLPPAIALVYAGLTLRVRPSASFRAGSTKLDRVLVAAVPGVLVIAAYNFLYVRSDFQGHWYFPVSVVLCSVFTLRSLERWKVGDRLTGTKQRFRLWTTASVAAGLVFFWWAQYRPRFNEDIARFYLDEGPRVRAAYDESPKVLEFYDAVFASATEFPTMNGYGLVVDADAAAARKEGLDAVFELAVSRGFDRVVSFNLDGTKLPEHPRRREIVRLLKRYVSKEALEPYRVEVEYRSEDARHVVVRVSERPSRR